MVIMMRRYAVVLNGVVLTAVMAESPEGALFGADQTAVEHAEAGEGWTFKGGTFVAPILSLESAKATKAAAVNARRDAIIGAGYRHNFGGTIGTRILDQRGPEDLSNWIALKLMAQDMNSAGQGDTLLPIRDANNATFQAKASVIEDAMGEMGKWRAGILGRSWMLKDAIAAAADQVALDAIDIGTGWE